MKRLTLSWGAGFSSHFIDLKNKKVHVYSGNAELHEEFGGTCYYTSRSGASGEGFITKNLDNILEIGSYRKCWEQDFGQSINNVYVLYPEDSGPVVVTDLKNRCAFFPAEWDNQYWVNELINGIRGFQDLDFQTKKIFYYKNPSKKDYFEIQFYNPNNEGGINLERFIEIPGDTKADEGIFTDRETFLTKALNLRESKDWPLYCFIHPKTGLIKDIFSDPYVYPEENLNYGWKSCGEGIFCKRENEVINSFIERERPNNLKCEGLSDFCEYEKVFNVFEWNSPEAKIILENALLKKMREDYLYARRASGREILNQMIRNPETSICIQDSLDAGNCMPGTMSFINRFDVKVNEKG